MRVAVREAVAGRREDSEARGEDREDMEEVMEVMEVREDMEEVTPLISRDPSRDISVITGAIFS